MPRWGEGTRQQVKGKEMSPRRENVDFLLRREISQKSPMAWGKPLPSSHLFLGASLGLARFNFRALIGSLLLGVRMMRIQYQMVASPSKTAILNFSAIESQRFEASAFCDAVTKKVEYNRVSTLEGVAPASIHSSIHISIHSCHRPFDPSPCASLAKLEISFVLLDSTETCLMLDQLT